ncbi:HipA family kinase [Roseibacillus persicicus]|uniref:HipA family kinase n=1 Tax=Roseibacillus persicicus TaxID=454148 RepID=UPI00398B316F
MKTITSILGRSAGGVSIRPFIGRSEGGEKFFLKPCGSLADSLIAEFIGSSLAQAVGLPVADFEIVMIPAKLAKFSLKPDFSELSAGPAFASRALGDDYIDLTSDQLTSLDEQQLAELYLFDFWIRNSDRILGKQSGNPNALCSIVTKELAIIDHDNAFSPDFSPREHQSIHFATAQKRVWADKAKQKQWLEKVHPLISEQLPVYWGQLPKEWLFDHFEDSRTTLNIETLQQQLSLPLLDKDAFWAHCFGT